MQLELINNAKSFVSKCFAPTFKFAIISTVEHAVWLVIIYQIHRTSCQHVLLLINRYGFCHLLHALRDTWLRQHVL